MKRINNKNLKITKKLNKKMKKKIEKISHKKQRREKSLGRVE